jgi:nucleoside-diphosphate-sugar epimerase
MAHTKKVAITGHTRGIGKFLVKRLETQGIKVKGFSKSNGYNIMKESTCKRIVKESLEWFKVQST